MNGYTECGPCASHTFCPSCLEPYTEGELVIQCEQCERWLHGSCDGIRNEFDAEKCADEKYTCVLCRPRDVPPPHLLPPPPPKPVPKPPTPTKSPGEFKFSTRRSQGKIMLTDLNYYTFLQSCRDFLKPNFLWTVYVYQKQECYKLNL